MNTIERRRYDMLVRVRDFGDTYGHLFPTSSVARQNFAAVAAAIADLDAQDLTRMAASASMLVERKTIAREALLARLQAIGRTARVLAEDAPGLDQQFQVSAEAADQRLLTTGREFVRDIEPFSSQYLAHGMPVTFVADLSVTVFEVRFGLALLPNSRKRLALERAFASVLDDDLGNRVLDFDSAAAVVAARLAADRRRAGRPADFRDTLIAGIAQVRRATVATRNAKHFEGLDVPVIDPWKT